MKRLVLKFCIFENTKEAIEYFDKKINIIEYISYINQGRTVTVVSNHKARYNNDRDIVWCYHLFV